MISSLFSQIGDKMVRPNKKYEFSLKSVSRDGVPNYHKVISSAMGIRKRTVRIRYPRLRMIAPPRTDAVRTTGSPSYSRFSIEPGYDGYVFETGVGGMPWKHRVCSLIKDGVYYYPYERVTVYNSDGTVSVRQVPRVYAYTPDQLRLKMKSGLVYANIRTNTPIDFDVIPHSVPKIRKNAPNKR